MDAPTLYSDNLRLGEIEFARQHLYLRSMPRCLGLVLGNQCNIDCPHCYQAKNADNLLRPAAIGRDLRREFQAFYPYLSTLRVQGGEAFAYTGFADLIDDVGANSGRPILSASTNGTLIDDPWAERIVRTPFRNLTVSIDGGTPETYARLRRGAQLPDVLANVDRIQHWKQKLSSPMPYIDSFFVVMRSNFRELPQYFRLLDEHGFTSVSLQTPEINRENSTREPTLIRDEVIADPTEVRALHAVLEPLLPEARRRFAVRTSGLTSLFEQHGLPTGVLHEQQEGLYPDSHGMIRETAAPETVPLCPNPWTTLFVAENGDVHLCFLSEPIGNLYEAPLAALWNSPAALAKRSRMIAGRYVESGCSPRWCSWRDGKQAAENDVPANLEEMRTLLRRAEDRSPLVQIGESTEAIAAVRRRTAARDRSIHELEAMFRHLCGTNEETHRKGQRYIHHLESELAVARTRLAQSQSDTQASQAELTRLRSHPILRAASTLRRLARRLTARHSTG